MVRGSASLTRTMVSISFKKPVSSQLSSLWIFLRHLLKIQLWAKKHVTEYEGVWIFHLNQRFVNFSDPQCPLKMKATQNGFCPIKWPEKSQYSQNQIRSRHKFNWKQLTNKSCQTYPVSSAEGVEIQPLNIFFFYRDLFPKYPKQISTYFLFFCLQYFELVFIVLFNLLIFFAYLN